MAVMKATTKIALEELLGSKYSIKIGNNTTVRRCEGYLEISLHDHPIIILDDVSVRFNLQGWPTVTTRERINQFLPSDYRVYQKDNVQMMSSAGQNDVPIVDNMWYVCGSTQIVDHRVIYSS